MKVTLELPEEFVGKKVEILAFIIEETSSNDKKLDDENFSLYVSESSLSKDWLSPEEDEAWQDL